MYGTGCQCGSAGLGFYRKPVRTLGASSTCLVDKATGVEICGQGARPTSSRYQKVQPPPDTHMPINRPELMNAAQTLQTQASTEIKPSGGLMDWLNSEAFRGVKNGYLVGGTGLLLTVALISTRH